MITLQQFRKIWFASRFKIVVLEQEEGDSFPKKILINGMVFSSDLYCKIYNYSWEATVNGVHLFAISVSGVVVELERSGMGWRVYNVGFPPSWTEEQCFNFGNICIPTKHCYIAKED